MQKNGVNITDKEAKENFKKENNIVLMPEFKSMFGERMIKDIMYFKLNNQIRIDKTVLLLEGDGNWRFEYLPTYKESRKNKPSDENFDNKAFALIVDELMEDIGSLLPISVIKVDEAEGDDLIGSIVLNSNENDENFIIMSVDKDFKQLQIHKKNVRQFTPVTPRTKENINKGIKKGVFTEVDADGYDLEYHIMYGDDADDIGHIKKGLGSKTIEKILSEEDGYNKWLSKLKKSEKDEVLKQYEINKRLIDLREIPTKISERCVKSFNESKQSDFVLANVLRFINKYKIDLPFHIFR
jgi:hypothetical protein